MPVIARTGAMLVIGHKAPMETSAIACRSESLNQRRKADRLKQVSGPQRCRPTPSRLVTRYSIYLHPSITAHAERPPRGRLRSDGAAFTDNFFCQPDGESTA